MNVPKPDHAVTQYPAAVVDIGDPLRVARSFADRLALARRACRRMYGLSLSIEGEGTAVPDATAVARVPLAEEGPGL